MKAVYWTLEATQDRDYIYDRIEADNPAAAAELDELFERKSASLAEHSALGRPGRVTRTRELVVHRNYILAYDLAGDEVRILRVLHARRQWPSIL
ncbi:type II toxin-antitoxin system RelE/ParE family toxin [Novosphingobium sp.]|uniref:type II toxin-antitoxin system RelE/ParE family toxin n=1 Tax=Novosphingobium sp. TaxID=1874826 RepID=UPI002B48443D|nr:type II toxin-antitoxin system RelE/ParE family toxin [Novosphingobium sp.]HKR90707.1 type II toxin-antitoxin system RelE/ParE family toxin [Novosphingobium sp.]